MEKNIGALAALFIGKISFDRRWDPLALLVENLAGRISRFFYNTEDLAKISLASEI